MARFFIDHPVFAMVIAIVIVILGAVAIPSLPVASYPEVVPPVVQITTSYLGGNAQDLEKTVAQPIEEQLIRPRRHALLPVHQRQRRLAHHPGHLQAGHQSRYRHGADAEPREHRHAAPAARSAAPGRGGQEGLDRVSDQRQPGFARQPLRLAVPHQLRADQPAEPGGQPGGRGRMRGSARTRSTPCGSG